VTKKNQKANIAIAHPEIGFGGSERRVFWGIEALKEEHNVTLITTNDIDFELINAYYGTSLTRSDFRIERIPLPFFLRNNNKAAALRGAFFHTYCKSVIKNYDVFINAYGPFDLGSPAIQIIADFSWDEGLRKKFHPLPSGVFHRQNLLRKAYLWGIDKIFYPSGKRLCFPNDKMIAVSRWVARQVEDKYKVKCDVVHSPVPGTFREIPQGERECGFVCLGRISSEKRIEQVIEILSSIRSKGYDIHLHIIGDGSDRRYREYIDSLVRQNGEWIFSEGKLFGSEKISALSRHLFGIHACVGDAFPGAVVEMIKAGCITFVHREGGSAEIVGNDLLTYDSSGEAVAKITHVLNNVQLQKNLFEEMVGRGNSFSLDMFMRQFRETVRDFLKDRRKEGAAPAFL
jgi:glycosyltransferase involved in cell wall biosynthesis